MGAIRHQPDGVLLRLYVIRCLMHYHLLALVASFSATARAHPYLLALWPASEAK